MKLGTTIQILAVHYFYPPIGDVAVTFVKYLLDEKKIPANLPLALTVQKESFKKR